MNKLKIALFVIVLFMVPAVCYAVWPYTMTYTPTSGSTIEADHINSSNNSHINNNIPESIDDFSTNASEMGSTADPYPASSESLATTLDDELERLRYQLETITNRFDSSTTEWYHDIGTSLYLPEAASASADEAAFGQHWVKDDTPCTAWFTDDAGSDFQITTLTGTETLSAKTLTDPVLNGTLSGTAFLDQDAMTDDSAIAVASQQSIKAYADAIFPRSYLAGLTTSNDTDTDHDINITAGECKDSANAVNIVLSSEITKQIDASWVAGDDAGGLSSSLWDLNSDAAIDTWYHVHVIVVSGTVGIGFDTSVTAANLVTDHSATAYRRIGSALTDGSANIIGFSQVGDEFLWDALVTDFNAANPGASAVTRTLTVPTGVKVLAKMIYSHSDASPSSSNSSLVTSLDQDDTAPTGVIYHTRVSADSEVASTEVLVRTNTSGQIRTRNEISESGIINNGITFGWTDRRGRDD